MRRHKHPWSLHSFQALFPGTSGGVLDSISILPVLEKETVIRPAMQTG